MKTKNLPMVPLPVEKEVDNEWFLAQFVRQDGVRLFAHIKYKKWSATAKKVSKELMDSFEEPLYAFIHDEHHLKFLNSLDWKPTGNLIRSFYPGKEDQVFTEVIYIKGGVDAYALAIYDELGKEILPLSLVDGYGNIEKIEKALEQYPTAQWTTKHHFSDGVYTRETFIPAGTCLTGYRHKQSTVSILASGAITVLAVDKLGHATDYGVMVAPQVVVTKPEMKKIGFAHEDTLFINSFNISEIPLEYHNEENISIIEEYIFDKEELTCLE